MSGYQRAMEAAGASVPAFAEFGSYQGDWWAVVIYEGKVGYVNGSYGSCSGCDAFECEFGWGNDETPEKLAAFGREYLDQIMPFEKAIKEANRNATWDIDADDMVSWLKDMQGVIDGSKS